MTLDQPRQTASNMTRFFLALLPPASVQAEATRLKEYFRDHYRSKAALKSPPHITLQAPFKWSDDDRDRLLSTLTQFKSQVSSVPITLSGFGAFPPRVIYIDVKHTDELMALQTELSRYLADALDVVDPMSRSRSFCPHLTVAFRDLKPVAFRRAWPEFEHREIEFSFVVNEIVLLRHTGQEWISYKHFPVQAP